MAGALGKKDRLDLRLEHLEIQRRLLARQRGQHERQRQDGCVHDAPHHAIAYASTRGSVPALSTPVFESTTIAASDPIVQGPATRSLCPRLISASRTASGTRCSTDISPGYIVCGNGDAGKLRVAQRGASIASCTFIPKSTTFKSVWIVRNTWSSPPGLPTIMNGWPPFMMSVLCSVLRGRFPGASALASPATSE